MNQDAEISDLLGRVLNQLAASPSPASFDFVRAFSGLGCNATRADLLADYLPEACGRGFLREVGVIVDDTYQRPLAEGGWGERQRFADDPLWVAVEKYVETIRTSPAMRKKFSLAAQHSAAYNAVSNGANAGKTLESVRGAHYSSVFVGPRKSSKE